MDNDVVKVGGQVVTNLELLVIHEITKGTSPVEICDKLSISHTDYRLMVHSTKVKTLLAEYVGQQQQMIHHKILAKSEALATALIDVATGVDKDSKVASAQVNALKLIFSIGSNPLLQSNPTVQINNQTNIQNNGSIKLSLLKNASIEDLLMMNNTGEIPDRFLEQDVQ